jgi:hypothetical protein
MKEGTRWVPLKEDTEVKNLFRVYLKGMYAPDFHDGFLTFFWRHSKVDWAVYCQSTQFSPTMFV